ncbi:MAG: carboxypeptidase regulatory-like domain-containing protein [Bacteroidetes bacterium]|nr:carboxypeptidase regulatory-like domain-containing protein [Bacteroidota bacterium]
MKQSLLFLLLLCLLPLAAARAQYNDVNSSLSLSGAGYISVPYSDDLNINLTNNGFVSISAWIRPTASGSEMTIVGNDRSLGYWFGLNSQRKLLYYPNPQGQFTGNATIPLNTWTHVAVSFNVFKNDLRFYVNGSLDRQINTGQTYLAYGYFDLRIGADRQSGNPALHWTGQIDEVRIWSTDIDFSTAEGLLYRIPLAMTGGRYGRHMRGGWRLNGNALSVDGQNDGTHSGTVSYVATPDPGHYERIGVQFVNGPDLGDHITIPHRNALSLTQDFTLECWVRPASMGGHAQYQTFISKGSYSSSAWNYWLGLNRNNGRVRFLPTGNWQQALESDVAIKNDSWTHVAARFEKGGSAYRATLFLNGRAAGSANFATTGSTNTHELLFGNADTRSLGMTAYGYSGVLDEVRIWNVARSNDEITDHYRMEFSGTVNNLVAVYRLDGDDHDLSGNGFDGTGEFRNGSQAFFISTASLPPEPTLALRRPTGGETWLIDDSEEIRWLATGLVNVRLELSRDGGETFSEVLASSVPATPGVFSWKVDGPETTEAIVRVRPPSTTMVHDASKLFEIEDPVPVLEVQPLSLTFSAPANGLLPPPQTLFLRNTGGATLSWTIQQGSAQLFDFSASAGTGNLDSIEVQLNTTSLPIGNYADDLIIGGNAMNAPVTVPVRVNITPLVTYEISGIVLSATGAPVEGVKVTASGPVEEHAYTDANGAYAVDGLAPGDYSVVPSSRYFDFTPNIEAVAGLAADRPGINFTARRITADVVIRYDEGWNLISLPMPLTQNDVAVVFPDADGKAYEYDPSQGYVEVNALEYGKGYWVKFLTRDSVIVNGPLQHTLEFTAFETFGGWNLMGAPSGPASVAGIIQDPSDALLSVYGYDPAAGYFEPPAGMLQAGRGYFIKVNAKAILRLVASSFASWTSPADLMLRGIDHKLSRVDTDLRYPGADVLPPPPPGE